MADEMCLLKMPLLVVEKILSNIHNLSNVSRTCKAMYEIICDMERHQRVMYIRGFQTESRTESMRLTIDDDAVFDSIMNSHRTIKDVRLRTDYGRLSKPNKPQLKRLTAILKQFGASILALELRHITLSINEILELLHQTPNLESLTFASGKVLGSATEKAKLGLQLSNLKTLRIIYVDGLLDIVNLIPPGSLKRCLFYGDQPTETIKAILTKQQNIKTLNYQNCSDFDLTFFCDNHLQLETFILCANANGQADKLVEILKCHMNLKELRLPISWLSANSFEWICNNLKNLEVFEVCQWLEFPLKMLAQLKKLRHFRIEDSQLLGNRLHFKSDSLEKLEITDELLIWCGEPLNDLVHSMVQSLPNLTYLEMHFDDFSALTFALSRCTTLTHLTSSIRDTSSDKLTQQRFPNIKHLELSTNHREGVKHNEMNQSMSLIVHAMPNLKSLKIQASNLIFDVDQMKQFINGIKNLDYLYVDNFELSPVLRSDDFVETMRCLLQQLKGYEIMFNISSHEELSLRTIKDMLSSEYYVQNVYDFDGYANENESWFHFYKGDVRKFNNCYNCDFC